MKKLLVLVIVLLALAPTTVYGQGLPTLGMERITEPILTNLVDWDAEYEPVIIERNGEVLVIADETGVHILGQVVLTQDEIVSIIPHSKTVEETRMSPHPDRAMTLQELVAWNEEYDRLGGINRTELELLFYLNVIRISHNLVPFGICPDVTRKVRIHNNLRPQFNLTAHRLPHFQGDMINLFDEYGSAWRESWLEYGPSWGITSGIRGISVAGSVRSENIAMGQVNGWMHSSGHRTLVLTEDTTNRWVAPGQMFVGVAANEYSIYVNGVALRGVRNSQGIRWENRQ